MRQGRLHALLQQFLDGFGASRAAALAAGGLADSTAAVALGVASPAGTDGRDDTPMGCTGLHVPLPASRDEPPDDSAALAQLRAQLATAQQAAADATAQAGTARTEMQRLAEAHVVEVSELRGEANAWGKTLLDAAGVEKERCAKVLADAVERDAERDRERDKRRKAATATQ